MSSNHLIKAGMLTAVIVTAFIICLESYWRSRGFPVAFNDDEALWSQERRKANLPPNEGTVFIGSSRIKFDLDVDTWEKMTGDKVVQLAMAGTSPRPLLHDLANDESFKGKLIIDVTEFLFFERNTRRADHAAMEALQYYKEETPSQQASSFINHGLESNLVLLEEGRFGLDELLKDLEVPDRPGVFSFPRFPKEFGLSTHRRQDYMTERFLSDTVLQNRQTACWAKLGTLSRMPGISGDSLQAIFNEVKTSVDKIRSRGGIVLFTRTPASGPMEDASKVAYPRKRYWDQLLAYTQTGGVHYEDYPETAKMICPEWSHLSGKDAVIYTRHLIRVLETEKGWQFPNKPASLIASH